MSADEKARHRVGELVTEIGTLHGRTAAVIARYTDEIAQVESLKDIEVLKYEAGYWTKVAYRNALIKLRLLLEQNFKFIETLGMLAVTRYVFEILVWLRCLDRNPDYGLVFFRQVIKDQLAHLEGEKNQVENEIALFEALEKEEAGMFDEALRRLHDSSNKKPAQLASKVASAKHFVETEIDRRARRSFSVHATNAKTNGYGFQAHLLRTQGIKQIEDQIALLNAERDAFDKRCRPAILKIAKAKWDWSQRAREVGMQNQYDFLYRYTSRLLHATPTSFFTDQKNLEPAEMVVFLDYVYVSMLDCLELAERRIGMNTKLH